MKTITILLIFLLSINLLIGQNLVLKSGKKVINTTNKKEKVDSLYDLAWEYLYIDRQKAKSYAKQMLEISEEINYTLGKINSLNILGTILFDEDHGQALDCFEEQLKLAKQEDFIYGIARSYHQLARLAYEYDDFATAHKHCKKAINYYEKPKYDNIINQVYSLQVSLFSEENQLDSAILLSEKVLIRIENDYNNPITRASIKINLGRVNLKLKQYAQTHRLFTSAASIYKSEGNNEGLATAYNNLGMLYQEIDSSERAKSFFQECIQTEKNGKFISVTPNAFLNLGIIFLNENKLLTALQHFKDAEKNKVSTIDSATIYFNIGEVYFKQNQPNIAIKYYLKALNIAERIDYKNLKEDVFRALAVAYKENENLDSSIVFYEEYNSLNDERNDDFFKVFDIKTTLEREKIIQAKQEKQQLIILGLFICLIMLYLIMRYRNKKQLAEKNVLEKQQKITHLITNFENRFTSAKMEWQDKERTRVAADLHDRLGSMLSTIKLYFKTIDEKIDVLGETKIQYNKANILLDDACEEVRKIAHGMQSNVLKHFGLVAQITKLAETINDTQQLKIDVNIFGLDDRIDSKKEENIYRIIQETVTNALKHANAKRLSINLTKRSQTLNIIIEDDGKGFDPDKVSTGSGLQNIAARVYKLGGEIDFDTGIGAGTTIIIDIDL